MPNWQPKTNVSMAVGYDAEDPFQQSRESIPVKVRVEYLEYNTARDTETQTRARHGAKLLYTIEDGRAALVGVEEVKGDDVTASATGFGFLRCVAAAEQEIRTIEGVRDVERGEETLEKQLEKGREAVSSPTAEAPLELELEHEPA